MDELIEKEPLIETKLIKPITDLKVDNKYVQVVGKKNCDNEETLKKLRKDRDNQREKNGKVLQKPQNAKTTVDAKKEKLEKDWIIETELQQGIINRRLLSK